MIELVRARAERSDNAADWTAELLLEELLHQIRDGSVKCDRIAIALGVLDPKGGTEVTVRVGGSRNALETIGLLTEARHIVLG